ATSDGPIVSAEIDLIESYATEVGLPQDIWEALQNELGMIAVDHWATLGIPAGSSATEIKAAFRRLLKEYHPDHFDRFPKEFRDLATAKTIALKQAYEALMARHQADDA